MYRLHEPRADTEMDIDWKHLATTPGYKSLKAAYIHDVQDSEKRRKRFKHKPMREKKEFLTLFNWIICRAKHYSYMTGKPIEEILNTWEENRNGSWWLNKYGSIYQPLLHSNSTQLMKLAGMKKLFLKCFSRDLKSRQQHSLRCIKGMQEAASTKTPKRWSNEQKKHAARYK